MHFIDFARVAVGGGNLSEVIVAIRSELNLLRSSEVS